MVTCCIGKTGSEIIRAISSNINPAAQEQHIPSLRNYRDGAEQTSSGKPSISIQADFTMIIFETTTSVFELMWDIALAYYVTQIALVYCAVACLCSCLVTFVYSSVAVALRMYNTLFFGLSVLVIAIISRLLIYYCEIPRVIGFHLAIGLEALIFMITAGALASRVVYTEELDHWLCPLGSIDIVQQVVGLLLFSLAPTIWMLGEGPWMK
jgi:hypothetical protein